MSEKQLYSQGIEIELHHNYLLLKGTELKIIITIKGIL